MDELIQHVGQHQDQFTSDVWNDANLGEVFEYLLNKQKGRFPEYVEKLIALIPMEKFFSEPLPDMSDFTKKVKKRKASKKRTS